MFSNKRRVIEVAVAFLILFAIVAAYLPVLNFYRGESARKDAELVVGNEKNPDHVAAYARVLSVDPLKGDMVIRLEFKPKGTFVSNDGFTAIDDVTLWVEAAAGNQERAFQKGKPMSPTDVMVSLYDGLVTDYPFDAYQADLSLFLFVPGKGEQKAPEIVPVVTYLYANLHGYDIGATVDTEGSAIGTFVTMKIARSATTMFFAIFIMVAQWVLALGVLAWALSVLIRGRRIEATLFGWVGAMLFAFPALRSAVPGAPPIGSLTDYLAFFWAEAIVMVSLVMLVYSYLSRPLK